MYNKSGKQLPEGWALGADGHESTDAPAVLANIEYFLLTMSINLLCAFCLWTLTKSFQIFGKMCPDIICISEDCGINGSKSMTDTCLVFKCTAFIRSNTHGKDGAENLAEHSITVTLMTSVYLFITAKWHDSAALL